MTDIAGLIANIARRDLQTRDGVVFAAERYAQGLLAIAMSKPALDEAIITSATSITARCRAMGYTEEEAADLGRLFRVHALHWLLN
jgi:hypothetical protein